MVLKCEPVFELVEKLQSERHYDEIIYTSPDGVRYDQHEANRLSTLENIIILCGHYKGIDHRIREHLVTREISIGDYVLTGGELAACIIADSVVRHHSGRHRRRSLGAHGLLSGQPAGAAGLHAPGRIPRLAGPRRAALGQLRPDRPRGRTNSPASAPGSCAPTC